jgi:hypothetical protein
MNIIDHRSAADADSIKRKFELCKTLDILAIGWTGWKVEDSTGYKKAYSAMKRLEIGDLVWVKDPINKTPYLCKITDYLKTETGILADNDINVITPCEYIDVSNAMLAKYGLSNDDLTSKNCTIGQCRVKRITDATKKLYGAIK